MPPGYVRTIREEILYEYAKLNPRSAHGSLQRGFITERFKKLRDGEINISDTIREWEREQELPKECVFCGYSGIVFPISARSLRVAYDQALEKAGISDFHFHDLRHTFATRLVQNGVDLHKVQKLLGHRTIAMTQRYAHHYPESLRSSVEVQVDSSRKSA
jgi:integrase